MKLSLIIYSDALFCTWILVFPIGIIEVSTPRIWRFLLYFSCLHDFWPPSTWISLVHTSWGKTERCEKRAFQLLKMRKKKITWNIKTKYITAFFWQLGFREWRIIFVIRRWALNSQTFALISKKNNENLEIFCLHVTGYANTKKSIPNCMFVLMISWKCAHHIYFTFLQDI